MSIMPRNNQTSDRHGAGGKSRPSPDPPLTYCTSRPTLVMLAVLSSVLSTVLTVAAASSAALFESCSASLHSHAATSASLACHAEHTAWCGLGLPYSISRIERDRRDTLQLVLLLPPSMLQPNASQKNHSTN